MPLGIFLMSLALCSLTEDSFIWGTSVSEASSPSSGHAGRSPFCQLSALQTSEPLSVYPSQHQLF